MKAETFPGRKSICIQLVMLVFVTLMHSTVYACDVCGAYMGVIPNGHQNYFGMFYRYRAFTGTEFKGSALFPDGSLRTLHSVANSGANIQTYEIYRVMEFRGRYYFHPKLEFNFILPYVKNSQEIGNTKSYIHGIGDATMLFGWHVFDDKATGSLMHRLVLGAGVKLPTGNNASFAGEKRADLLLQTGTGSTDPFFNLNYAVTRNQLGIQSSSSWKMNTTNQYKERIGDSFTEFLNLFYKWRINCDVRVVPSLQSYYEFTNGVYLNNHLQNGTRMNVLMGGAGVDFYYKEWQLSVAALRPLREEITSSKMKSTLKCVIGCTWSFDQSGYLFRKQ